VSAKLGTVPRAQGCEASRYIREKEAAAFLGVSVFTLQSWRSRGNPAAPPVTKVGGMVMYSVRELEMYMEMRTVDLGRGTRAV
jgi:predicted DNA-binding transcriptional regulator AlpA